MQTELGILLIYGFKIKTSLSSRNLLVVLLNALAFWPCFSYPRRTFETTSQSYTSSGWGIMALKIWKAGGCWNPGLKTDLPVPLLTSVFLTAYCYFQQITFTPQSVGCIEPRDGHLKLTVGNTVFLFLYFFWFFYTHYFCDSCPYSDHILCSFLKIPFTWY